MSKDKKGKDKKNRKNRKAGGESGQIREFSGNKLLEDSIRVVHSGELEKDARTYEKKAESDDRAEDEGLKIISTSKAPAAVGPYSQAVVSGDFLFISGQIPVNPKTGEIDGDDISTQARRVCKNIGKILRKAGADYEQVVKTTCFLSSLDDFMAFNEVYGEYFTGKPARSCVAVREIPKGVLCEVEAIAYLGD